MLLSANKRCSVPSSRRMAEFAAAVAELVVAAWRSVVAKKDAEKKMHFYDYHLM